MAVAESHSICKAVMRDRGDAGCLAQFVPRSVRARVHAALGVSLCDGLKKPWASRRGRDGSGEVGLVRVQCGFMVANEMWHDLQPI
jgi:hypothetical protein